MFVKNSTAFPSWNGNALISGMATASISRVVMSSRGGAKLANRWAVGHPHPRSPSKRPTVQLDAGRR